jgi:predicted  nucleic acid-binding Zn-ribbon protein
MGDLRHDIHVLVSIAKLDASLAAYRSELVTTPGRKVRIDKALAEVDRSEKEAKNHFAAMQKERRRLETGLDDKAALVKKYKTQLMEVKTNKEYTALLKEIERIEKEIDESEEKLLILMDEIEEQSSEDKVFSEKIVEERKELGQEKASLEEREGVLREEMKKLSAQKPAFLKELDPQLKKKYDRLLVKLGDYAVTNVIDGVCQGCHSRIPPQMANEVKLNDRIILCEECGRILVYY